jgi:predicted dehydrogenase/kynurenine formamidase
LVPVRDTLHLASPGRCAADLSPAGEVKLLIVSLTYLIDIDETEERMQHSGCGSVHAAWFLVCLSRHMPNLTMVAVGAGYFSQFHFEAWSRIAEVELTAVCDIEEGRARRACQEFGIPRYYTDFQEMLDREAPDVVDIITRPESHAMLCAAAAARGISIICQKPLAPTFEEARRIVVEAEQAGTRLMVHENFRFQPWHREIKRLIEEGTIGRPHYFYFRSRPGDGYGADAYLSRQPYFRTMPRFLVQETGVHFIDTFRYLAGEVDEVQALLRRLNPVIAGEDAGLLTFRFANGAIGVWDANRCNETTDRDPRYTFGEFLIEGDQGSLRLYGDGRLTLQPLGGAEREHAYVHERRGFGGDCVFLTQRHFVDRLIDGGEFETGGREYLKTLAVEEAVYQSNDLQRSVRPSGRMVDLTLAISNDLPRASVAPATTIAENGWNSTTLTLYSHCGTHMDAPRHFLPGGRTIDQQPLDVCCGPAKVLDLTPVAPSELLTVERLAPWAAAVRPGDRLLLRTDWHHRLGTPEYRHSLPRISVELARWFVERRVALVGVEPPSVADVNNLAELTEVHQTLLRAPVVIVEGLAHLDQLASDIVYLVVLPLRVRDGDGSPVRAIAFEEPGA